MDRARGERRSGSRPEPSTATRFRATSRRAVQGRDVRLEGFPARRPAVPGTRSHGRPGTAHRGPAGGRRRAARARRQGSAAQRSRLAPQRSDARVHGRRGLAQRPEVQPARHLDGHARRSAHAAHRRRVRPRRRGLLAGRQVPVVLALVRHRHDHREEAESWRAARPLRRPGVGRRADQPDGELGSRSGRRRSWSPDSRFMYFTRGHRRRESSVPRVRARRQGRADDEGPAPA